MQMAEADEIPMRKPNKQEREDLLKIFSQFDENGDKKISAGEMHRALKQLSKSGAFKKNPMTRDAKKIIESVDVDDDGYVSYKEFEKVMMKSVCAAEHQHKIFKDTFDMFDLDGNGEISRSELIKIFKRTKVENPVEFADELLNEADRNGDGNISYQEFVRVFFNEQNKE